MDGYKTITWRETWSLIREDVVRKTLSDGKPLRFSAVLMTALSPSVMPVILFRFQYFFYHHHLFVLSKLIMWLSIVLFSVEIGSRCRAGGGLILGHANGIVIHDQVVIGRSCTLMHQCGLGLNYLPGIPEAEQFTVLEDDVFVGAGAKILGPCVIGQSSWIGMNAMVTGSFPERSVIAGVPARRIRFREPGEDFAAEPLARNYGCRAAQSVADTLKLIRADLEHRAHVDGKKFDRWCYVKLFLNPAALAVFVFRWAACFDRHRIGWLAKIFTTVNILAFKTDIGCKAEIKGGLVIGHANGVMINHQAKIGKNALFFHQNSVAIGPRKGLDPESDRVVIGDNFIAGAGARILGNIVIGNNCVAGLNAVVVRSAPDNTVLAGIPARGVEKKSPPPRPEDIPASGDPAVEEPPPTFRAALGLIRSDIDRRARMEGKKGNAYYYLKVLLNPPAMAVVLFRLSRCFIRKGWYLPAKLLYVANNLFFTVEIQPGAVIGPGFVVAHANSILIHDKTVIGKNCTLTLHTSITIGPREGMDPENDRVVIGDEALIGMGTRIIGNIRLGNSVVVGAGAVVTKSAPDGAVLVGVPAVNQKAFSGEKG
ncbi:MAG: serine O-acetyltransferase [Thermodesulfobacteriota bacterium]